MIDLLRDLKVAGAACALGVVVTACVPDQPPVPPPQATAPAKAAAPAASAPLPPLDPENVAKVDEMIGRYVAAHGGIEKLRGVKSIRVTGKARMGWGGATEADVAYEQKRGGFTRNEFTFQGLTGVDAYDGKDAWGTEPFGGRREPFRKGADDAKMAAQDADLDGPLIDWREKGHRVDYLGTEDIDGTLAHKLRVARKDGDVEYWYLDPDAFLEIRVVKESHMRGVERVTETDYGEYDQVAGMWMAFASDSGGKGEPRSYHFRITRVEINVDVDDAAFHFPAPGTRVDRSIFAGPPAPPSTGPEPAPPAGAAPTFDASVISGLGARNIGSAAMSGRVSTVAARTEDGKTTVYVGAASGGVWKSFDGGTTFKPIFDLSPVQSIGAITIDPTNDRTVWVGTGEAWTRNSVSIGDGIYKSTDAGATWKNMGLPESERIAKIVVHPTNGDIVYACVPGKLWSDSPDRGVYKTEDGGKRWSLVLRGQNLSTGCSGITIDPKSPDVLLAGMWDFRRKGWTSRSGGDGPDAPSASGLYRTADGGKTWTPMTAAANAGLPAAPWGRVEVVIAPSDPKVVYALIESKKSALFRSDDGGATWSRRDDSQMMVWRPFYFARLVVDPTNPDRIFKPDGNLIVSEDGGKSFSGSGGGSHGDWHDLWIDPGNPKRVIGGDDGGFWTSTDGGSRWWKSNNLPISQFYHVSLDQKDPYNVYGGLQDNSSWVGPSAAPGGITNQQWQNLYGGDGFWTVVDPSDPEAVYAEYQGGFISRVDRRTMASRDIQPKAGYKEKLRFNWNTPIHVSPTQKSTIYIGGQFLFRSKDRGQSWDRISPDLTTNDPEKQKQEQSGGVTVDNSSAEMHTTIYAISESPRDAKVIWVGTDDGNVQITRDGGKTWTNVVGNVPGLPKNSWVSWVEASRFDAGTAYAVFDRHTFGDMTPWAYRTTDYGKTWTRIVSPEKGVRGYAHVLKEDVVSRDLLFLGTELGLWISVDGGARWAAFKGGDFPAVAVREVQVHPRENDLVIATHGRGIWIVDDLTPLRALTPEALARPMAFLPGRPVQQRLHADGGWVEGDATFVGRNPPSGAVITYYQRSRHLFGPLKLEVLDDKGQLVNTLDASARRGLNRVMWSMQVKPPRAPRGVEVAFNATRGPRVLPGTYTVRLTKGHEVIDTKLVIGLDRRAPFKVADRKAQFEAAMGARALFDEMSKLNDRIEIARGATLARAEGMAAGDALGQKLHAAADRLEEARKKIVATKEGGAITGEERIREHLDQLYGALLGWEGKPASYQVERLAVLRHELADVAAEMDAIATRDLRPLDAELKARNLAPIPTAGDVPPHDPLASGEARCAITRGRDCPEAATVVTGDRD